MSSGSFAEVYCNVHAYARPQSFGSELCGRLRCLCGCTDIHVRGLVLSVVVFTRSVSFMLRLHGAAPATCVALIVLSTVYSKLADDEDMKICVIPKKANRVSVCAAPAVALCDYDFVEDCRIN